MAPIRVIVSGATGATGRRLVPAYLADAAFTLVGAVGRRVGEDVGTAVGIGAVGIPISATFAEANATGKADILVDFSASEAAARNGLDAVKAGVNVLLGTTAVDRDAIEQMGRIAEERGVALFLAPNLTLVGQLLFRCADMLRPYFGNVELIETHATTKRDAPSGTALETVHRLHAQPAPDAVPDMTARGLPAARGADVGGVRVHSVRLPGYHSRHQLVFARPGEAFTVTAEQFTAEPLVAPTVRATRMLMGRRGVVTDLPGLFEPEAGSGG